ncbi:BQ2448_6084 [Microbotryum intermedium]|uniref:BQ2448_6084 protein n=1 Tax=Microbotryum intermedium TaxID=269621 RepID=A0A238FP38_9BASI|nr:BQ2448_6084 [Microbotryum intermedium]
MQDLSPCDAWHHGGRESSLGDPLVTPIRRRPNAQLDGSPSLTASLPESDKSSRASAQASSAPSSPPSTPSSGHENHSSVSSSSGSSTCSDEDQGFEWQPLRDVFIKPLDNSEIDGGGSEPPLMPEITWESGEPSLERDGLTNIIDVYRESKFRIAPKFLRGGGGKPRQFTPRAMEVVFHERCFDPIWVIGSTASLARVMLGAAKGERRTQLGPVDLRKLTRGSPISFSGLRNLYRMSILHRDISARNIMVDQDGPGVLIDYDLAMYINDDDDPSSALGRGRFAGTFPFLARPRFPSYDPKSPALPHQPWHDIESLAYVLLFFIFSRPEGPNDPKIMSDTAKGIWSSWDTPGPSGCGPGECKMVLFRGHPRLHNLLDRYETFWTGISDLVGIVVSSCGLKSPRTHNMVVEEELEVEAQWEQGQLSYDRLVAALSSFVDEALKGQGVCGSPTIGSR